MSLVNKLNRFIYMHGAEDIIQVGVKIFNEGRVSFVSEDKSHHTVVFKTKDDIYDLYRTVTIRNYYDMQAIKLDCTCTHQRRNLCKHTVASLFYLKKMIGAQEIDVPKVSYNQASTVLKMGYINSKYLQNSVSPQLMKEAEEIVRVFRAKIERGNQGEVKTQVKADGKLYPVTIKFNQEQEEFTTSCTCEDKQFILCKHKLAVFLQISRFYGTRYFSAIYNNPNSSENPPVNTIVPAPENEDSLGRALLKKSPLKREVLSQDAINQLKVQLQNERSSSTIDQIIFRENINIYPHYSIIIVIKRERYEVQPPAMSPMLSKALRTVKDKELVSTLLKLTHYEMAGHLASKRHLFHGMFAKDTQFRNFDAIPDEMRAICFEYLQSRFRQLHNIPQLKHLSYWQKAGSTELREANKLSFSNELLEPIFFIELKDEEWVQIRTKVKIDGELVDMEENELMSPHAFLYRSVLYAWRENHYDIFVKLRKISERKIPLRNWGAIALKELRILFQHYNFHIDERLASVQEPNFERKELFVRETDQFLHFQLYFYYGNLRAPYDGHQYIYQQSEDNSLELVRRNIREEQALYQKIQSLHPRMVANSESGPYPFEMLLSKEDALQKQWFLTFADAMKNEEVVLTGLEQLKKFSAKEVKPMVRIGISSGIDWLEMKMEVRVENELLSMRSLLPVLEGKASLVALKNGRVILIAKSWIKQWKLLFKLAEKREGMNFHFRPNQVNLINAIANGAAEITGQEQDYLFMNWSKEARKLLEKPINRKILPPASLRDTLKNYQKESFYWFQHLKKNAYNGLLGDDMGLGKTLQVLTNLLYEKERNRKINALIICPATLICTWEEEVQKFTPTLRSMIYHSAQRTMDLEQFRAKDLIITTYGVIRSDVALFKNYEFDYVILDESQMIKNPSSNTYQAVMALRSKHRICLSGTPLQNNTFDLYAQINFLNPDFLGPVTFFRDHFSIPIDRHGDKETQQVLKNAIRPLFLRRTKEEVSPELPDKNVNILYCEMEEEQRRIYENCKAGLSGLLEKVRADGIQYYKMHVLQALTKLRMICNAPSLLNTGNDNSMPEVSVKRTLLLERIKDNVVHHKVIVFSQFLGMLDLLRKGLEEQRISFEYLDGSTTVKDREKSVRKFREGEEVRVFLVSLKAGGVGLNLTAADYVYIVDPWWNPTVEMQAIDRTHRIGQTKKVFAHRMICKNSIEEQIISLQEKKFKLSKALIDKTDDAFLRNITVDDLAYLLK